MDSDDSTKPKKRKHDSSGSSTAPLKRLKLQSTSASQVSSGSDDSPSDVSRPTKKAGSQLARRLQVNKLQPARPFPTVPPSVSETGPRSAHREGKNMICITRKTPLGAYMRRCKKVIIEDGYKILHLTAMGAAIPLLLQLVSALPATLPFSQDEIHWEVTTGSVEVVDEIIPEEEEEDLSYQTRCKSNLFILFKVGSGEFEGDQGALRRYSAGKSVPKSHNSVKSEQGKKGKAKENAAELVFEEPEQDFMEML